MNKKFFIKNFLILCFALLISGRLAYGHFSHIQEQDKKVSHLCSEIEEIRLSHRTMDWKPTGNDVLDKIKKEAPVGLSLIHI